LFEVGAEFIKFLTHFDAAVLRAFLFLVFFIDLVSIMSECFQRWEVFTLQSAQSLQATTLRNNFFSITTCNI
jgi:hypothetical protein